MYNNDDKIYVVEHAQGAWSIPEYVSTVYGDVQDFIANEFINSDLDTGKEEDEELFFADYNIVETSHEKLNDIFKDTNGTGFIITTESIDYVQGYELQVVRKDDLSPLCKSDDDAVNKAREMGIEILDVDELPDKFAEIDDRRACILDTKANRLALEDIEKNIPLEYYNSERESIGNPKKCDIMER